MSSYKDPIIETYLNLIKTQRGDIRKYFNGLVTKVAASECPCIMIGIDNTEVNESNNVDDEHRLNLILVLVTDIRQNYEDSVRIDNGVNKVQDILIGRESNLKLKSNSILNIIRTNVDADSTYNLRTDLGEITVATPKEITVGRLAEHWSTEGTISFQAYFSQER